MGITKFSERAWHAAQRFYNVLCIAYGADKKRLPTWSRRE